MKGLVPLLSRARRAALLAMALLQGIVFGSPTGNALGQSLGLGALVGHIPIVRSVFGVQRQSRRRDAEVIADDWEWMTPAGEGGESVRGRAQWQQWEWSSPQWVPSPVAQAVSWSGQRIQGVSDAVTGSTAGAAAAAVHGGCRGLQRVIIEPVQRGSSFLAVSVASMLVCTCLMRLSQGKALAGWFRLVAFV